MHRNLDYVGKYGIKNSHVDVIFDALGWGCHDMNVRFVNIEEFRNFIRTIRECRKIELESAKFYKRGGYYIFRAGIYPKEVA